MCVCVFCVCCAHVTTGVHTRRTPDDTYPCITLHTQCPLNGGSSKAGGDDGGDGDPLDFILDDVAAEDGQGASAEEGVAVCGCTPLIIYGHDASLYMHVVTLYLNIIMRISSRGR